MPHIFTDEEIAHIIEIADSYPSGGNNTVPHIRALWAAVVRSHQLKEKELQCFRWCACT